MYSPRHAQPQPHTQPQPHPKVRTRVRVLLISGAILIPLLLGVVAYAASLQPAFDQAQLGAAGATRAWGVAIADLDNDGDQDFVSGDTYGDVWLFKGDGAGNYAKTATAVINAAYHNAYGLAAADFNGDGNVDIAMGCTADGATDGVVYFYRGNGNGTFQSAGFPQLGLVIGDVGTNVTAVAAADVDGDGDQDLVAGDVTVSPNAAADVVLYRNGGNDGSGNPTWSPETIISAPDVAATPDSPPYFPPTSATLAGYGLAFGDANGDGSQDLFVTDRAGYVYIWANNGAGTFAPIRFDNISTGTRPYAWGQVGGFQLLGIAAGDLNGDGLCDFVVGTTLNGAATDGKVMLFLNEGMSGAEPLFTGAGEIGGNGTDARGVAIGQLNESEDAYRDVLFGNFEGCLYGLFADLRDTDGDGITDRFDNLPAIANYPTIDLNGDGAFSRADQIDLDGDGIGSVWDDGTGALLGDPDADGDGVPNGDDNLPMVPNPDQKDEDADGIGEVTGPWPLGQVGDVLDDRDPDGDGIPNGPFDASLLPYYQAARAKLMTGDTPIMLRIDALGRWWQAEFTQTLADSIYMDEATFAAEYAKNWDGTYGAGAAPPAGLEGGKDLSVSLMLIPKLLWTDPTVVGYLNNRLPRDGFELGQHGTYHNAIQPSGPDSEMNGYDPLEMYAYMRVGQDTMLGIYDRPDGSDYLSATAASPKLNWTAADGPLVTFAPPYDEYDISGAQATALLGYAAFTSDIWVEDEARTLMGGDYSDQFDQFGALHAAANFMPWGTLADIPTWAWEPPHATYAEYIQSHIVPGQANCILIEEVNFSGKSAGAVDNTIDPVKWANFQTMLDVVKAYPGGVVMTVGEYAMARAYDNDPLRYNPEQIDADGNGVGDAAPKVESHAYSTDEDVTLIVNEPGVLGGATDPNGDVLDAQVVDLPAHGTLTLAPGGSFTYVPDPDYYGLDEFTYQAWDGEFTSNVATATITVNWVNDPPSLAVTPAEQAVQYSDPTADVRADFGDDGPHYDVASHTAFPADIVGIEGMSNIHTDPFTGYDVGGGHLTFGGLMDEPAGDYPVTFTMNDTLLTTTATTTYRVSPEDAFVTALNGPVVVDVDTPGGTGHASFSGTIAQADDGYPGDLSRADVRVSLVPVGPGPTISKTVHASAAGAFAAAFTGIPVNVYSVVAEVVGGYFASAPVEDVFTVTDPSLGKATGGGWFYWPGTHDRTTFGFVTMYGKRNANFKGSLVMIRHTASGNYRVKSNALLGLALGESGDAAGVFGWCSFSGKATYIEPGWPEVQGNYTFTMYAEDRNQPGTGVDRFWIQVFDRDGAPVAASSLDTPAAAHAAPIEGGNIVAPHQLPKK